jgi:FAS-associated factor 2
VLFSQAQPRSNSNSNSNSNNNAGYLQRGLVILALLLRIALWPLRRLSAIVFPGSDIDGLSDAVTAKAAQQFVSYLQSLQSASASASSLGGGSASLSYANETRNNSSSSSAGAGASPVSTAIATAWNTIGFSSMQQEAVHSQSLLFVYLHSPLHRDSDNFCRNMLLHPTMLDWLNQHGVEAIGVSIHTAQGAQLASLLQATSFPLIALLHPRSATSMSLILKVEGPVLTQQLSVDQLLPYLHSALGRHLSVVAEHETRRLQREQEVELRRQQDQEYHETLAQDQERERTNAAEREMERQTQLREEERVRQEEEEAQQAIATAMSLVKPAPESGGTMVRFVLPSGMKLNRRFASNETMAALRAYLRLQFHEKNMEMGCIGLSTSFPRKTYNEQDDQTLEDLGLSPQAVLMVQDLDA